MYGSLLNYPQSKTIKNHLRKKNSTKISCCARLFCAGSNGYPRVNPSRLTRECVDYYRIVMITISKSKYIILV